MLAYSRQALEHQTNHDSPNHRPAVIQLDFIITAKASRLADPTKSSFPHPPLGQNLDALGSVKLAHNFKPQLAEGTKSLNPRKQ